MNYKFKMALDKLSWVILIPIGILCIPITIYRGVKQEIEFSRWIEDLNKK